MKAGRRVLGMSKRPEGSGSAEHLPEVRLRLVASSMLWREREVKGRQLRLATGVLSAANR
jgi:hypothetical protein